jgi:hypothetical protein
VTNLHEVERELGRIVDRLNSMPLPKVASASDDVHDTAEFLVAQTRLLGDSPPAEATLPRLAPQGLGAMLAVIGHDYVDAARASSEPDVDPVLNALVELRRALP